MNIKILKIFLIVSFVVTVLVEGLFLFVLPKIVNKKIESGEITNYILQKTNLNVDLKNTTVKTRPDFSMIFLSDEITVFDKTTKVFGAKNLNLRFSLPAIALKRLVVSRLKLDNGSLFLTRELDKKIYLGSFVVPVDVLIEYLKNSNLNGVSIKSFDFILNDKIINKNNHLVLNSAEFYYKKNKILGLILDSYLLVNSKKTTDINIKISTKLPLKNGLSSPLSDVNINIFNLNLSDYSSYIAEFSNTDLQSINGVLNLKIFKDIDYKLNLDLKNFNVKMQDEYENIFSKNLISVNSVFNLDKSKLIIKSLETSSKDIHIFLDGCVHNIFSKKIDDFNYDLKAKITNTSLNSLYWLLPSSKDDEQKVIQKIKKYGAWGVVNSELHFLGKANNPHIFGDMIFDDVYIVKDSPEVLHSSVIVKFLKDKLELKTRVVTKNGEYVDVVGISELRPHGKGDYKITSSKNVDLALVLYMLVPISDVVGFDLGPLPYMQLKGLGNIDIDVEGTIEDGFIDGNFNFKNVTAQLTGLNTAIDGADGSLLFNKKEIDFQTNNAFINNHQIKLYGKADLNKNVDFSIVSKNAEVYDFFNILKTSQLLEKQTFLVSSIENIKGSVDIFLNLKGVIDDYSNLFDDEKVKFVGNLKLKNARAKLYDLPFWVNKIQGIVSFDTNGWTSDLNTYFDSSKLNIKGYANNSGVDLKLEGNSLKTDDVLATVLRNISNRKNIEILKTNSLVTFRGEYKSNQNVKDLVFLPENLKLNGSFLPISNNQSKTDLSVSKGVFNFKNGDLDLKDFCINYLGSQIKFTSNINKILSDKPVYNGVLKVDDFDISALNKIKNQSYLPNEIKAILNAYDDYWGNIDILIKADNNNFNGYIDLNNIKLTHSYYKTPISVDSGKILLKNSKVKAKSIVAQFDNTPVFIDFTVDDLDKKMHIDGYITTKITENFVNKYVNNFLSYPIKVKGDISLTLDIKGPLDEIRILPKIVFAQGADVYYMGVSLGDEENKREILGDIVVKNRSYNIKKLNYIRYIISQNDIANPLPVFNINGVLERLGSEGKNIFIKNLNIETLNNANAKIFNIIFKKSILKNGMFNCKLNIKGDISNPIIKGKISGIQLDMPLYNALIKNLDIKFNDRNIDINAIGMIHSSDYEIVADIKNSFVVPYVVNSFEIKSQSLNLNNFIDALTNIATPDTVSKVTGVTPKILLPFKLSDLQIKKGTMYANDILVKGLPAKNYRSEFRLDKDSVLYMDNVSFDVANGKMTGSTSYNFTNGRLKANANAIGVDSNELATKLLGLKEQIFGQANANIVISTKGLSEEERLKNMHGHVYFEVFDGKMPKLGSVEYLLRAGNFIKSGVTGASISNFIDLIAPIKTGHFDTIKGSFALKNGVAQNIEVYSRGENLNIYINGEYDVIQQYANMKVYGRLTKKANNILGVIGNLSFNSLLNSMPWLKLENSDKKSILSELNKIPGVELSDKQYRIFTAKIDGYINQEKFVKNFRWIE